MDVAIYSSYSVCPASVAAAACSSSLSECPCSPLVISFIPIITVAVGGNSISSSVGFFNAISVIIVAFPPGIKSAWYRHYSPGVDNGAIFSRVAAVMFGAEPIKIWIGVVLSSSQGAFKATCPFKMWYGVVS